MAAKMLRLQKQGRLSLKGAWVIFIQLSELFKMWCATIRTDHSEVIAGVFVDPLRLAFVCGVTVFSLLRAHRSTGRPTPRSRLSILTAFPCTVRTSLWMGGKSGLALRGGTTCSALTWWLERPRKSVSPKVASVAKLVWKRLKPMLDFACTEAPCALCCCHYTAAVRYVTSSKKKRLSSPYTRKNLCKPCCRSLAAKELLTPEYWGFESNGTDVGRAC